jgi:hypothetical protein
VYYIKSGNVEIYIEATSTHLSYLEVTYEQQQQQHQQCNNKCLTNIYLGRTSFRRDLILLSPASFSKRKKPLLHSRLLSASPRVPPDPEEISSRQGKPNLTTTTITTNISNKK